MLFNGFGVCFWCLGFFLRVLKEWRLLLELFLLCEYYGEEFFYVCVLMVFFDWLVDLMWNNVIKLMFEWLGVGYIVNLL